MDDACFCGYETSYPYVASMRRAAKPHRCCECGYRMKLGEQHEYVTGKCEGEWFSARTCGRCLAMRAYVKAHVPCFCWAHHNMLQDAADTIEEYAHQAPGLFMGYGRLLVAIKRNRAAVQV